MKLKKNHWYILRRVGNTEYTYLYKFSHEDNSSYWREKGVKIYDSGKIERLLGSSGWLNAFEWTPRPATREEVLSAFPDEEDILIDRQRKMFIYEND